MRFRSLLSAILCVCPVSRTEATTATDLMFGHYEIHIDYTVTPEDPDAGWQFSVSYDQDDDFSTSAGVVRMDPDTTTFIASPKTAMTIPSPAGVFARFGPAGTPIWVMPQNEVSGTPFLGVRTTMAAGLFQARVGGNYTPSTQGSVSLKLISVEGTGPDNGGKFATWKTESFGTTVFSFDTTDGISDADEIATIPVSSHTHYNWGFTKPGLYRVTFEASGKLMRSYGNVITRARKTFLFAVPVSSRVGEAAEIRISSLSEGPEVIVADPANRVAYAPDQSMIEVEKAATGSLEVFPSALWETPIVLATDAVDFPDSVGISPELASAGLSTNEWSGLSWEIDEVRGPGRMVVLENDSVVLDESGGTIALQPASSRNLTVAFEETGIYRMTGTVSGTRGGNLLKSKPVTLVFGAGLTAEFDYAAWQNSFEKTAGLPTGTLVDPLADSDHDGVANAAEFAFFWHGLDPTRADGEKMPGAFQTAEGFGAIGFIRDTFKDPLDMSNWQIEPSASTDLVNWSRAPTRTAGDPLEIFETGIGPGTIPGRITKRQLRVMPATQPKAFFRFHITPP
jgi:surface-anchored protein